MLGTRLAEVVAKAERAKRLQEGDGDLHASSRYGLVLELGMNPQQWMDPASEAAQHLCRSALAAGTLPPEKGAKLVARAAGVESAQGAHARSARLLRVAQDLCCGARGGAAASLRFKLIMAEARELRAAGNTRLCLEAALAAHAAFPEEREPLALALAVGVKEESGSGSGLLLSSADVRFLRSRLARVEQGAQVVTAEEGGGNNCALSSIVDLAAAAAATSARRKKSVDLTLARLRPGSAREVEEREGVANTKEIWSLLA